MVNTMLKVPGVEQLLKHRFFEKIGKKKSETFRKFRYQSILSSCLGPEARKRPSVLKTIEKHVKTFRKKPTFYDPFRSDTVHGKNYAPLREPTEKQDL